MRKCDTVWNFPEEKQPSGTTEFDFFTAMNHNGKRITPIGTFCQQVVTHPWFAVLWEPLTTKVPGPHLASPYYCYIRTIIFYQRPMLTNQHIYPYCLNGTWRYSRKYTVFRKWAEIDSSFCQGDIIILNQTPFEIGGSRVLWYQKRWWVRHWARKKETV